MTMETTELYNIQDGDSGRTVADGLKRNFESIIQELGILGTGSQEAKTNISDLLRDLGLYPTVISLPLAVEKSGKYVDPDGQEQSSALMGVSAPLEVKAGNIYLLQCAAAVGTGVALFSRKVTNTYDKVIAYSYTYNGDGTIATATADYDPELVYSYSYNEEGVATITDKDGESVPELPATHQVTESFYEPLFRTNDATMPKSGYYLLLCTQARTCWECGTGCSRASRPTSSAAPGRRS